MSLNGFSYNDHVIGASHDVALQQPGMEKDLIFYFFVHASGCFTMRSNDKKILNIKD